MLQSETMITRRKKMKRVLPLSSSNHPIHEYIFRDIGRSTCTLRVFFFSLIQPTPLKKHFRRFISPRPVTYNGISFTFLYLYVSYNVARDCRGMLKCGGRGVALL